MTTHTLRMVYYALFHSIISYGIIAWGGVYSTSKIINKNKFIGDKNPRSLDQIFSDESLSYYYEELQSAYINSNSITRNKSIQIPRRYLNISIKSSHMKAICDGVTCSYLLGAGRTRTLVSWALSYCQRRGRPARYTRTCTLESEGRGRVRVHWRVAQPGARSREQRGERETERASRAAVDSEREGERERTLYDSRVAIRGEGRVRASRRRSVRS